MADSDVRAGTLFCKIDGEQQDAKGSWKLQVGGTKKTGIAGVDRVHGPKEEIMVPYIEGVFTDNGDFSIQALQQVSGTVTLELVNGKSYALSGAWYAGEGELDPIEGEIAVKFEGKTMKEILA